VSDVWDMSRLRPYLIAIVIGILVGALIALRHKGYHVIPAEKAAGAFIWSGPHTGSGPIQPRDVAPLHRETGGFQ
jgi:hypothetical protein